MNAAGTGKLPILLVCLLLICHIYGCSGKKTGDPVIPGSEDNLQTICTASQNRILWGLYDISVPADRSNFEIVPLRIGAMHLNVTGMLEGGLCSTCLKIANFKVVESHVLTVEVTVTHPMPGSPKLTGFDVRGIFIS